MSAAVEESLVIREGFEEQHDKTVREEIERFRAKAAGVLAGTITDDEFRPFRLRYGIYGQRQPGVQMVRTKVPGGAADRGADGADGGSRRRVWRRASATSPRGRTFSSISFRSRAWPT